MFLKKLSNGAFLLSMHKHQLAVIMHGVGAIVQCLEHSLEVIEYTYAVNGSASALYQSPMQDHDNIRNLKQKPNVGIVQQLTHMKASQDLDNVPPKLEFQNRGLI